MIQFRKDKEKGFLFKSIIRIMRIKKNKIYIQIFQFSIHLRNKQHTYMYLCITV